MNLESVALAIEGSDLNITEDNLCLLQDVFQDSKQ